jgi:hypothetical protein
MKFSLAKTTLLSAIVLALLGLFTLAACQAQQPAPPAASEPTVTRSPIPPAATPAPTSTPTAQASATPPPTPTLFYVGDLGDLALTGIVYCASGPAATPAPVAEAHVSYSVSSYVRPTRNMTVTTDAKGQFAFPPLALHDTDRLWLRAEAPGCAPQEIQRTGLDIWNASRVDFTLQPPARF